MIYIYYKYRYIKIYNIVIYICQCVNFCLSMCFSLRVYIYIGYVLEFSYKRLSTFFNLMLKPDVMFYKEYIDVLLHNVPMRNT